MYNEKYEKIGFIKDIFGPIDFPFISIKSISNQSFNPEDKIYTKINWFSEIFNLSSVNQEYYKKRCVLFQVGEI